MLSKRHITTAAVTIMIALGSGHVMQYGLAGVAGVAELNMPAPRPAASRPKPARVDASILRAPSLNKVVISDPEFPSGPEAAEGVHALPDTALPPINVPKDVSTLPPGASALGLDGHGLACAETLNADAAPGAMIHVSLTAPCRPDETIEISHAGLSFTSSTNGAGVLDVEVPALSDDADITITMSGGEALKAHVAVPDARYYERVALQWSGPAQLSVHALEPGAQAGDLGHVNSQRPNTPYGSGAMSPGGFLVSLGTEGGAGGARAEVYSFAAKSRRRAETVRLSVTAQITAETCAQAVPVRTLRTGQGGGVQHSERQIAFPDCRSIGRILVLKNLLEDLKIAHN